MYPCAGGVLCSMKNLHNRGHRYMKRLLQFAGVLFGVFALFIALIFHMHSNIEPPEPFNEDGEMNAWYAESLIREFIDDEIGDVRRVQFRPDNDIFFISFYADGDDDNAVLSVLCFLQTEIEPNMRVIDLFDVISFDEDTIGETVGSLPEAEWEVAVIVEDNDIDDIICGRGAPDLEDQVEDYLDQ